MDNFSIKAIAHIYNDYTEKFGIPRQSGLVPEVESVIIFEKEFQSGDYLRGIEEFSHLWLIWQFSESDPTKVGPTVRPPRLGGNKRVGVFATRSPFRPNALGLSSVKLLAVEKTDSHGAILRVSGADLMNGTPIIDVKPYLTYADCHSDAVCGFTEAIPEKKLDVVFSHGLLEKLPPQKRSMLIKILENDPRPRYHDDKRIYTFSFSVYEVSFYVEGETLTITDIKR